MTADVMKIVLKNYKTGEKIKIVLEFLPQIG